MTSRKFVELEKRVKALKKKKLFNIFLILLGVFGIASFIAYNSLNIVKKEEAKKEVVVKKEVTIKPKKVIKIEKKIITYDTIKLSPVIEVPKSIEKISTKIAVNVVEKIVIKKEEKPKIILHVREVKSEDALLKKFRVSEDFESAIGLAKIYYENENYKKSVYFSKKASILKSTSDTSWIIYAKSKYKLKKIDEAINALQLYLQYSESSEVKKLLREYRSKK